MTPLEWFAGGPDRPQLPKLFTDAFRSFGVPLSSTGPRCASSSARICGQRLPQRPLLAIGLTMILVFMAISAGEDNRASLTPAEG